jgi:hypothetical protein
MSRQIISSPFHWDVQIDSRKGEVDGGSVATSNIMVDTRVVRRRTFNASSTKNTADMKFSTEQPGCFLFDRRFILGDIFADPIVTVTGEDANKQTKKEIADGGQRIISTPPPVKGRRHISVQTVDDTKVCACERSESIESCAQTVLRCSLQDRTIGVDREEHRPPASTASIEKCSVTRSISCQWEPLRGKQIL